MIIEIDQHLSATVNHLNSINESIRTLQERSTRLSNGLANRTEIKNKVECILKALIVDEHSKE